MGGGRGLLDASIGKANRDRAWLINDTLLKAMEALGLQIQATKTGLVAIVDGERLSLQLGETTDQDSTSTATAELKTKADWEKKRLELPALYNRDNSTGAARTICPPACR